MPPPTVAPPPRPAVAEMVAANRLHPPAWVGPAILAAGLAAVAWVVGLQGTDTAAQAYRAAHGGLAVWDPGWYGGSYPLSYSVLAPLLMAGIGLKGTGVLGAAVAAGAFARLTPWPAAAWAFAASTLIAVGVGQLTYLCGEAVGLLALLAAVRGRPRLAVALAVLTALCSPLAAAFLVLAGLVLRRWAALAAAAPVLVLAGLFPGDGPFPFSTASLAATEALCALAQRWPRLRRPAAAYGLAALASFLVANPLGGNAARLAASVGIPLVAGAAWAGRRWLVLLVPLVVWQWAPATSFSTRWTTPASDRAAFYQPLRSLTGRIEVVPTRDHWEAADVPTPRLVLARGWERQVDIARDPIFYRAAPLTASGYLAWLRHNGVTWVALPAAPLDSAGRAEAALLRRGVPGLRRLRRAAPWTVWRVDGSPGLGPVTRVGPGQVRVEVARAGAYVVRFHWTPYWRLGPAPPGTRIGPAPGGWISVRLIRPGTVVLDARLG